MAKYNNQIGQLDLINQSVVLPNHQLNCSIPRHSDRLMINKYFYL